MPPPQLAADAPRFDVFQPVIIGFFATLRDNLGLARAHGLQRGFHDFRGFHEPLVRQHGFDHHLGAVAEGLHDRFVFDIRHGHLDLVAFVILLDFGGGHGQTFVGDLLNDQFPRLEPIQPAQFVGDKVQPVHLHFGEGRAAAEFLRLQGGFSVIRPVRPHMPARVKQTIHRDIAALGHLIIVEIMCAGDFHRARPKGGIGIFVGDDRDQTAVFLWPHRDFAQFAHDGRIAFIAGMHGHGAIAQHGFRARRSDRDIIPRFAQGNVPVFILFDVFIGFATGQRVFEVPHVAGGFDVFDL